MPHRKYSLITYGLIFSLAAASILEGSRRAGLRSISLLTLDRGYGFSVQINRGGKETRISANTWETPGYGHAYANRWDEETGDNFENLWFIDFTP